MEQFQQRSSKPPSSRPTRNSATTSKVYPKLYDPNYRRLVRNLATVQKPGLKRKWLKECNIAEAEAAKWTVKDILDGLIPWITPRMLWETRCPVGREHRALRLWEGYCPLAFYLRYGVKRESVPWIPGLGKL